MKPRRRNLVKIVLLCGLTIMAIAVAIATSLGAIGEPGLAVALGIVAFVQLSFMITVWRWTAPEAAAVAAAASQAPHTSSLGSPAAGIQHGANDDRTLERDKPDMAPDMPDMDASSGRAPANDAAHATARPGAETTPTGANFLDQGRLDLHLEPVVELTRNRTVYYRANLALTRPDGIRVGPYLLALSADHSGLAPALDVALFRRVCPVIRHLKARRRRTGVFCPLSPTSFAQRDVLDELIQFLKANSDAAGAMVIEISQPALAALSPAGMEGLAYLAELGATMSLSQARPEGPDLETLIVLGFRFLDLDIAALASTYGWDAFKEDGEVCRLARRAEQAGLSVIAANVVRSEELEHVRDFARLARGSLFSPPRVVRREIMELPAQAAAA
jgi:EAL domain-containing protein (putative c-di-GMP-specific phosphodiesterase class I)